MTERPILFSAPMVRALLGGSKTQTRRVMRDQPPEGCLPLTVGMYAPARVNRRGEQYPGPEVFGVWTDDGEWALRCPYGQPGDALWVRETWGTTIEFDRYATRDLPRGIVADRLFYAADMRLVAKTRARLYMPRWASRITLRVTDVRVQRVQDISDADAVAEGVESAAHYAALWDDLNGDTHPWAYNPWVWAITFEVQK